MKTKFTPTCTDSINYKREISRLLVELLTKAAKTTNTKHPDFINLKTKQNENK